MREQEQEVRQQPPTNLIRRMTLSTAQDDTSVARLQQLDSLQARLEGSTEAEKELK